MLRRPVLLSALWLLSWPASWLAADEATPVRAFRDFDHETRRGLPASSVMDLYQDEQGVLWLATLDGLATFDGETLAGVGAADAPRFGALRSIAPRPGGGFYVGGSSRLYVYDGQNWKVLPADDGADALALLGSELWRLDRRGRLSRLAGEKPPWMPVAPPAGGLPLGLEEGGGELYLATAEQVWRRAGESWEAVGGKLAGGSLTALLVARDGSLWAGSDLPFLFSLPAGATAWRRLPLPGWQGGRVRALAEDQRGRIWAGGLQGGLAFGRETFTLWNEDNGLHRDGILALLADREGSLWISLNGHGLQQWLGESWTHRNRWQGDLAGDPRHPVFGITPAADGGFYAAVFSRGIWHWDGRTMAELGRATGLSEDVRYAYEPAPGELWVGARYGIFEREADGRFVQTLTLPSGFVYAIVPGPGGRHFALTSAAGIYERRAEGWRPVEDWNPRLPSANVRTLLFRADGSVWVGTFGGLRIFGPDGRPFELGEGWSMVPEAVNALLEVDGEVWIAGYGGLAICRDPATPCRRVDPAQLPGQTYYSLARAADGAVWLGGSAGVGRYADGQWQLFDAGSGLIEDECNHYGLLARPDGQVLVGTMASLGRFEPRVERRASPQLAVYWAEAPQPGPDGVARLAADERTLTLRWRAPWLLPRQLEYRVRVPRLRAEWLPPQKENFRHLESLGPGEWEVEVAARLLPGGEWTAPIATRFEVEPRFHETRLFKLLCGVALLFACAGLVHWRTRRLARRAAELQQAVEAHVASLKTLHGLLPICASCKKIRDDRGYWQQLESYLRQHSEAELSHGFCPECFERITSALDAARERAPKGI